MKIDIFCGKGKIGEIFNGVGKSFRKRWKSETWGKCMITSGGNGRPWTLPMVTLAVLVQW